MRLRSSLTAIFALALIAASWAPALAQGGPAPAPQPPGAQAGRPPEGRRALPGFGPGGRPADVPRLFEAYFLMQAQQALGISDAAYPQFVAKMKALLDLRRTTEQQRFALVRDLRQLTMQQNPEASEAQVGAALKKLKDFDASSAAEVKKASDALDAVLDVRQQARLRVFEEQMERRKLDLLLRARSFRGQPGRGPED